MKDGSKKVIVLVSNPALENIELSSIDREAFDTFKHYRKSFERIASEKYARGHVEADGTVCIRAIDVPAVEAPISSNVGARRVEAGCRLRERL